MGKRYTQVTAALEWLKSGKTLTRYEGFMSLRIADLPKVIGKLRKKGTVIDTEMISHKGCYGPTQYAKYHFIKEAPKKEENKGGNV